MIYGFISIERFHSEEKWRVGQIAPVAQRVFSENSERKGKETTARPAEGKQDQIKDRSPSNQRVDSPYLHHIR